MTSCHNLSDGPYVEWRGVFDNEELNALHAECFDHPFSLMTGGPRSIAIASAGSVCVS